MQRSTHRILTTHVGSLARPDALIPLLRQQEQGQPYDRAHFARLVRQAVADVVRQQVETGIDIVTDGEQGKASFYGYVMERFNGFERKPAPPGQETTHALRAASIRLFLTTMPGRSVLPNGPVGEVATVGTASTSVRDPLVTRGTPRCRRTSTT